MKKFLVRLLFPACRDNDEMIGIVNTGCRIICKIVKNGPLRLKLQEYWAGLFFSNDGWEDIQL